MSRRPGAPCFGPGLPGPLAMAPATRTKLQASSGKLQASSCKLDRDLYCVIPGCIEKTIELIDEQHAALVQVIQFLDSQSTATKPVRATRQSFKSQR